MQPRNTDNTPTWPGWTLRQAACWIAFGEAVDNDPLILAAQRNPLPLQIPVEDLPSTPPPLLDSDFLPPDTEPATTPEMIAALEAENTLALAGQNGELPFSGRPDGGPQRPETSPIGLRKIMRPNPDRAVFPMAGCQGLFTHGSPYRET